MPAGVVPLCSMPPAYPRRLGLRRRSAGYREEVSKQEKTATHAEADALDSLARQNEIIADLAAQWSKDTQKLMEGDDVHTRWERGSAVKYLLQHLAVREEAKGAVVSRLRQTGAGELADALEGDGPARREEIDALDEASRGTQAINLNSPAVDREIERVIHRFRSEQDVERTVVPKAVEALGEQGRRDLPSGAQVRRRSVLHPNPEPGWSDRVGALKILRAVYQHLRGAPSGGTTPAIDLGREAEPGPR